MTKQDSRRISKENEEKFQSAQKKYHETGDEESWNQMWFCVYLCCENMCKNKGKGIIIPNLEEKAMDATIKIMGKIKEGISINKLSSYCYFPVIEQLYNLQTQFDERTISYESWESYQYAEEESGAKE